MLQDKRREIYFRNRAAQLQRTKFKLQKERVFSFVKEMQMRGPLGENQDKLSGPSANVVQQPVRAGHFNIMDIVQLLNLTPENQLAIYDVRSPATCNDYSTCFFLFFFFFHFQMTQSIYLLLCTSRICLLILSLFATVIVLTVPSVR